MAPWLAITSATPRPVLSAALGSSHRGQTETITSSVPVSVDRQQKKLSAGEGAAQALMAQDTLFLLRHLSWGYSLPPTLHWPPSALAWSFWAGIRGLGWGYGGLDSLRWNSLQVNGG